MSVEMELNQSYRVNTPDVVHENIDGEVVIVNLATGTYYSTSDSGLDIWNGLDRGLSVSQIAEAMSCVYAGDPEHIRKGVEIMVEHLTEKGLVVPLEDSLMSEATDWISVAVGTPFRQPDLQSYTDMEDLLMLDPIHEVADTDWPQPRG